MMRASCPVCESSDLLDLLRIPEVPVHCNRLWDTRAQALGAPKGEIGLTFCQGCTHIFNRAFDPAQVEYDSAYENSLFFSPRFQTYAQGLAEKLVARYDLREKTILEIGSGQGEFLRLLCELGHNRGLGFDPSYGPEGQQPTRGEIQYFARFFTPQDADREVDFVCCRHVLEHLQHPRALLDTSRRLKVPVFFEVPNALYTLRDLGIWDLIYEHPSYFTPGSLEAIFRLAGFDLKRREEVFGGQFLTIEAWPSEQIERSPVDMPQDSVDALELAKAFSDKYRQKIRHWERVLAESRALSRKIVLWGAGSKGVTFLNVLPTQDQISYIVDINPRKLGRFIPGSGQEIVDPKGLKTLQPDVVILMNQNYKAEIQSQLSEIGFSGQILIG